MLGVKDVDAARVLEFLNHCLRFEPGFERSGKKFSYQASEVRIDVTATTVRSLAAALVSAEAGEKKVHFTDLRASAVKSEGKAADATLRKYCQTFRDEWREMVIHSGLDEHELTLPTTSTPIPVNVFGQLFDLDRVRKVQYKLRQPTLHVNHDDSKKDPIPLDALEPDTWTLVGSPNPPEPRGKIVIKHSKFLSRSAFQIKHGEGGLRVQLLSRTNKLEYEGREQTQFVVPHGEEFVFADLAFRYWEGGGDPEKVTPRYGGRQQKRDSDGF